MPSHSNSGPFTVWCDSPITHRKYWHFITAVEGEIVYRASHISRCIDWLANEGQTEYCIKTEMGSYHATVILDRSAKE